MSRIFLFVIDGFGVYNPDELSTILDLKANTAFEPEKDIPFLYQNGLNFSIHNQGNCMFQKSIEAGSFIGHQEMFGRVFDNSFDIPNIPIDNNILYEFQRLTGTSLICNQQGRGDSIIPKYLSKNLEQNSIIMYRGYDSTIILATEQNKISLDDFEEKLLIFRELIDKHTDLNIKKVLGRYLFLGTTIKRIEVFPKCEKEISNIFNQTWNIYMNRKVWEIFRLKSSKIIDTNSDKEIFSYFSDLSNAKLCNEFYFFNFEDFDKYAHLNEVEKCKNTLIEIDNFFTKFYQNLTNNDWLIITADHGVRFVNSDLSSSHKMETVPVIVLNKLIKNIAYDYKKGYECIREIILDIKNKEEENVTNAST